jgi:hypothetical protein
MMESPMAPESPVRVIYAKLTSTGAYDVVAHTANVSLERARSVAEPLLPGNPPLDAAVDEEVSHLRPAGGGHIVLRFGRYDWRDGGRGDVYMTDIAWFPDAEFLRARANAFALVPRTDRIFDVLTELPDTVVEERTAAEDLARIAELRDAAAAAQTVAASAMAADPVLLLQAHDRARALELLTLLLPPGLRAGLTFQTQAFRVPAVLPRITLADRGYANLRDGPWKILPHIDENVPHALAGELVALANDGERLLAIHELYDDAYADDVDLRTGVTRMVHLAAAADALRGGDAARALSELARLDAGALAAGLRMLRRTGAADRLETAVTDMVRTADRDSARNSVAVLRALDDDAEGAAVAAAAADALPASAPDELVLALAASAARHGDLPRLLVLLARDRRTLALQLDVTGPRFPPDAQRLVGALRDASGPRHGLGPAAALLRQATAVAAALPDDRAAGALQRMARDAAVEALDRTDATRPAVDAMLELQDAAAEYTARVRPSSPLPALLLPDFADQAGAPERSAALAQEHTTGTCAVAGAALLARGLDAQRAGDHDRWQRAAAAAVPLLERAGQPGRELALRVLRERDVRDHDLSAWPGGDAVARIIGVDTRHAGATRRLRDAMAALHSSPETALQDLAGAVFAARRQGVRLSPRTEAWTELVGALRGGNGRGGAADGAALEIALELLSVITDPVHLSSLEEAALADAAHVRLRRLDRGIAVCRAAEQEDRYEMYARLLESTNTDIDAGTRERLRDALGTRSLERRFLRMVSAVVEKNP